MPNLWAGFLKHALSSISPASNFHFSQGIPVGVGSGWQCVRALVLYKRLFRVRAWWFAVGPAKRI